MLAHPGACFLSLRRLLKRSIILSSSPRDPRSRSPYRQYEYLCFIRIRPVSLYKQPCGPLSQLAYWPCSPSDPPTSGHHDPVRRRILALANQTRRGLRISETRSVFSQTVARIHVPWAGWHVRRTRMVVGFTSDARIALTTRIAIDGLKNAQYDRSSA